MANHIENYINIVNGDENVLNEIKRIFEYELESTYKTIHTEELAQRVYGEEAPVEYDREWYVTKTGAKWMYGMVEDWDVDDIRIVITSAWDPINEWLERLSINLIAIKEDVVIENKFEDEGLNFLGVGYFSKEYTDIEYLDEDIDGTKFWEDDDYRDGIYEMLDDLLLEQIQIHKDRIEELKNEQDGN